MFANFAPRELRARFDLLCRAATLFNRLSEADFVILGEKGVLADVGQIQPYEVLVVPLDAVFGHEVGLLFVPAAMPPPPIPPHSEVGRHSTGGVNPLLPPLNADATDQYPLSSAAHTTPLVSTFGVPPHWQVNP